MKSQSTVTRPYSTNPFYSPVPLDFLYWPSDKPSLILKVNSMPAICEDCTYEFNAANNPVISSATLTANTYTIALTNAGSATIADITVSLLDVSCSDLSGTAASFTCQFPTNAADSSVALPAGNAKPIVHLSTVGYADDTSIVAEDIDVTVTSMTPASSSPGGGVIATLDGTGFPVDSSKPFTISICGNSVTQILTVSNKQITFIVPPMVTACSGNSQIVVNQKSTPITFAYDAGIAPSITSLNITSSSPILKAQLTIQGSQFGSIADTYVYLYQNGVQKY